MRWRNEEAESVDSVFLEFVFDFEEEEDLSGVGWIVVQLLGDVNQVFECAFQVRDFGGFVQLKVTWQFVPSFLKPGFRFFDFFFCVVAFEFHCAVWGRGRECGTRRPRKVYFANLDNRLDLAGCARQKVWACPLSLCIV